MIIKEVMLWGRWLEYNRTHNTVHNQHTYFLIGKIPMNLWFYQLDRNIHQTLQIGIWQGGVQPIPEDRWYHCGWISLSKYEIDTNNNLQLYFMQICA